MKQFIKVEISNPEACYSVIRWFSMKQLEAIKEKCSKPYNHATYEIYTATTEKEIDFIESKIKNPNTGGYGY